MFLRVRSLVVAATRAVLAAAVVAGACAPSVQADIAVEGAGELAFVHGTSGGRAVIEHFADALACPRRARVTCRGRIRLLEAVRGRRTLASARYVARRGCTAPVRLVLTAREARRVRARGVVATGHARERRVEEGPAQRDQRADDPGRQLAARALRAQLRRLPLARGVIDGVADYPAFAPPGRSVR